MPIHPDDYESLMGGSFPRADDVIGADDDSAYGQVFDQGIADSLSSSGSLHRDSSGIDLSVLGLGAANINVGPQGQHTNVELPAKLQAAQQVDQSVQNLVTTLKNLLSTNQQALLASPQTQGLVGTVQNAIADLVNVDSQLQASFWNGQNFNTFTGSTNAWTAMDQASVAATQKLQAYSQLPSQLQAGVTQGTQALASLNTAAATVAQAIGQALTLAQGGQADQAVALLQSSGIQQAAQVSGHLPELQTAMQQAQTLAVQQKKQSLADQIGAALALGSSDPASALSTLQALSSQASSLGMSSQLQGAIAQVKSSQSQSAGSALNTQIQSALALAETDPATALASLQGLQGQASALSLGGPLNQAIAQVKAIQKGAAQVASLQQTVAANVQSAQAVVASAQSSVSQAQSAGADVGAATGMILSAQSTLQQVQNQLASTTDVGTLNSLNGQVSTASSQAQQAASIAASAVSALQRQQAVTVAQAPAQQQQMTFDQQLQLERAQADLDLRTRAQADAQFEHAIAALASLAPILGQGTAGELAGAAIAEQLGIDPATIGHVAGGTAPGGAQGVDPDTGEVLLSGFGPESF